MTNVELAKDIIRRQIEGNEQMVVNLIEELERLTARSKECVENGNMNGALGYVESIVSRTRDIKEYTAKINTCKEQMKVIEFIERN